MAKLPPETMLRLDSLSKSFGSLVVLNQVTLDILRGKTTAIIGPSGTGKSVLLKHIVGLMEPDYGHVWIAGPHGTSEPPIDITTATDNQKYVIRRRFGMLFQDGALFDSKTVGENVSFPLDYHTKLSEEEKRHLVDQKLTLVELPGFYDRPTASLSGGQRKRVGLARAIALEPEVVLFDEPNSGLDPLTSDTIDDLIGSMKTALGITFIVITHDIISCTRIADELAMLYQGKLIASGPRDAFLASEDPLVRRFLKRNLG